MTVRTFLSSQWLQEKGTAMYAEENKMLARRFGEVWGGADLEIVDNLAAPGILVYYPLLGQAIEGPEAFKQLLDQWHTTFPDGAMTIDRQIAENEQVVNAWTFTGTHSADFMGISPTGKIVTFTGITIYGIAGGMIAEERGVSDVFG